ncbi:hypothetical protein, partial [Enhygromyxa salina]|uniref:hypothetical protein n=1 Tax=Enhygromyxa salina TaxID=215803 RepID=UPI0011BA70BE
MPIHSRLGAHAPVGFDASTQALLSALIREVDGWEVTSVAGSHTLSLELPSQAGALRVPLREAIGVGRIAAGP